MIAQALRKQKDKIEKKGKKEKESVQTDFRVTEEINEFVSEEINK